MVGGVWCTTLGSEKGNVWIMYERAAGYLLATSGSQGVRNGCQVRQCGE